MTDAAAGLSVLHVIVRAGPTNSQYNEHVLPVLGTRRVTVCSLYPADVQPPDELNLFEGDGSVGGCFRALRRALVADDYDVVHVHAPASGIVTLLTYLRMWRPRRDLVFTVHNSWGNFRRRNRLFLRLIMMLFPMVVLCGQAAYDSLPAGIRRRRQHQLHVVPNGVDVDRIDRALEGVERGPRTGFRVVSVNRLIPLKHPHTTVTAFTRMRKAGDELVMVGDGPMRYQLEDRIQHEGLVRTVLLRGVIPRDEVYRQLGTADVFISTSAGEGLPVALLEAMACGVPVVVTDIPPHREVARSAHGLPLVPVGDSAGFARALERVRAADEHELRRMAERLRACVVERYSVSSMNEAYGELYRRRVPRGSEVARGHRSVGIDEEQVSVGEKLRHRWGLLVAMTLIGAVVGFGIAFVQAPVYKGETSLQVGRDLGVAASEDTLNTSAALAIRYADLARREPVLGPLVDQGYGEDWRAIQRNVFARPGDKNPQLVEISVYAGDREEARDLATAVARSLERASRAAIASSSRFFLGDQLRSLQEDIVTTTDELERARAALPEASDEEAAVLRARIADLQATLAEQRSSYTELDAIDTSESGQLSLVDAAWTTRSPLRPTPLVLAVVGAAAGLTLGAAWVHLFSQHPPSGPPMTPVPELRGREEDTRRGSGRRRTATWAAPDQTWHDRSNDRR